MKHFDTKPEDRVIAPGSARNDIIIFDEHGLEINPVYSMDYSTGIWSNVVAVGYESGFVSLVDTQEDAKKKVLGGELVNNSRRKMIDDSVEAYLANRLLNSVFSSSVS